MINGIPVTKFLTNLFSSAPPLQRNLFPDLSGVYLQNINLRKNEIKECIPMTHIDVQIFKW